MYYPKQKDALSLSNEEIKKSVKEKYTQIALQPANPQSSGCCGSECGCSGSEYSVFNDSYSNQEGYNPDADLGLGCGLPTDTAGIAPGDTVVDLGSGAGNDCFVARALTGETGRVIGVDMTEEMINKANNNIAKLGYENVEFRLGEIENLPVEENQADVVISNCVLNLVPDKKKAFAEIHRILKPGGHFSISDVVLKGDLPEALKTVAELYAGCVSGALPKDDYMSLINETGFKKIKVEKEKVVNLPDEILLKFISENDLKEYRDSGSGIFSITVTGYKL